MLPAPPKWIWEPSPEWIERTNVHRFMQRLGITDREQFIRFSQEHLEEFWAEMVKEACIHWLHPYERVLDTSDGVEWSRWFTGGKLNITDNCLDRHQHSNHIAILWEGEDRPLRQITFADLYLEPRRDSARTKPRKDRHHDQAELETCVQNRHDFRNHRHAKRHSMNR